MQWPDGTTLYISDLAAAQEYRKRWLNGLARITLMRVSRDKWREAAISAIVIAIALIAVLVMEAYVTK